MFFYQIICNQKLFYNRGDSIRKIFICVLVFLIFINGNQSQINLNAKLKTMYTKTTVNIRDKPNIKSKIVGRVYWNEKVKVIQKQNRNWYAICYKGRKRFISAEYLKRQKTGYRTYNVNGGTTFKSYEDASYITDNTSILQGKLKQKYHMDYNSGVYMIDNRYCVAVGSYFTKIVGTKMDLVLLYKNNTHILKCIAADSKSDQDTNMNHSVHKDGSVVEFVVNNKYISDKTRMMGDVSYSGNIFRGKIKEIRVNKNFERK